MSEAEIPRTYDALRAPTVDELFRASLRVKEQIIRRSITHDGTLCYLVPQVLVPRFVRALETAENEMPEGWRKT